MVLLPTGLARYENKKKKKNKRRIKASGTISILSLFYSYIVTFYKSAKDLLLEFLERLVR
jgi:hypothetical protein